MSVECDGNFKWWWGESEDGAYMGPFETRDQAIAAATAECVLPKFEVIEADKQIPDYRFMSADWVLETFVEHNELLWNIDQNAHDTPTYQQCKELEDMLADAIKLWFEKHKLGPYVYVFGDVRNREVIANESYQLSDATSDGIQIVCGREPTD